MGSDVRERIQAVIAETFGLDPTLMYLTKPTFFSRINSTAAKTQHDEYWHPHIDKVTDRNGATTCLASDNEAQICILGDNDLTEQIVHRCDSRTCRTYAKEMIKAS